MTYCFKFINLAVAFLSHVANSLENNDSVFMLLALSPLKAMIRNIILPRMITFGHHKLYVYKHFAAYWTFYCNKTLIGILCGSIWLLLLTDFEKVFWDLINSWTTYSDTIFNFGLDETRCYCSASLAPFKKRIYTKTYTYTLNCRFELSVFR